MTIRKLVGTLENKGPYIDQATGHWFYWNGTRYVDSGYPYAVKPIISFKIEWVFVLFDQLVLFLRCLFLLGFLIIIIAA